MHPSWVRKTPKWCSEQRLKNVMAQNKKEEGVLQQKLGQLHREESQVWREHNYDIWKTAQALNARKRVPSGAEDSAKLRSRRNSLPPFTGPTLMNTRRRHSVAYPPMAGIEKESGERYGKEEKEDILSEIDNDFKFLSVAFGTRPSPTITPTSSHGVKLPEIKSSSAQGSRSDFKSVLMRRRHSDVTTLRRLHVENRRSSLASRPGPSEGL